MAAGIREATNVEAELSRGDGGIFDVEIDGALRFSKHEVGRYPDLDEIISLIREASP